MSALYHACHRRLQDEHGTRALADRHENLIVHGQLLDDEIAFVESRDMLLLSTIDPDGRPTVSYKGGDIGFIRVVDGDIVIPSYDGNGMFLSLGNAASNPNVGLLFTTSSIRAGSGFKASPETTIATRKRPSPGRYM